MTSSPTCRTTRRCEGGVKVQGSKFKVQGSKFKVQSSKFKVQSSRFKVQSSRFKVQSSRFKAQEAKLLSTLLHSHTPTLLKKNYTPKKSTLLKTSPPPKPCHFSLFTYHLKRTSLFPVPAHPPEQIIEGDTCDETGDGIDDVMRLDIDRGEAQQDEERQ